MQEVLGNPKFPYEHAHIVVVHGIGDQAPNETALNFMNHLIRALPCGAGYKLEVDNLIETVDDISKKAPEHAPARSFHPAFLVFTDDHVERNYVMGFSEVYWQNITNEYLEGNHGAPPIPIFVWAHSINTRLFGGGYGDYRKVIDNLEKMFGLFRKLAVVFKKSGVLLEILNRFLGDVQMYAESDDIRGEINKRFRSVMARVHGFIDLTMKSRKLPAVDFTSTSIKVYVVAHSEGTVVAYTTMVEAARNQEAWVDDVRGFVTLGSPLSKHFLIWRNRFKSGQLAGMNPRRRIPWYNYWDHSDPVGFGLKSLFAQPDSDANRLFDLRCDAGFDRYPIPGLAHVRYWTDPAIYREMIRRVMRMGPPGRAPKVASRWWGKLPAIVDVPAHWAGRLVTGGALAFFAWKLLLCVGQRIVLVHDWLDAHTFLGSCWKRWGGDGEILPVKDAVGYAAGLAVCVLIWKLHTTVHEGLLQMWRYTKGTDTEAKVPKGHGAEDPSAVGFEPPVTSATGTGNGR